MSRKLADVEQEKRQAIAAYQAALFNVSPDPILVVSAKQHIVSINHRTLAFFRKTEAEVCGRLLSDFFDSREHSRLQRLSETSWGGLSDQLFTLKDGRVVSLNSTSMVLESEVSFLITIRDESTREAIDSALLERTKIEAMNHLSSMLTMDLNDSITIVQGRLELLLELEKSKGEHQSRHLLIAFDHVRRVAATLDNLRLVGRKGLSGLSVFSVQDVLDQALVLVGRRGGRRRIQTDLGDLKVSGILPAYARVVANLLSRVLDSVKKDDEVVVRAFQTDSDLVTVQIYGGPALVRFDDLLSNSKNVASTGQQQSGLPLDMARIIAEQFGGEIEEWRTGSSIILRLSLPGVPHRALGETDFSDRILFVGHRETYEALILLMGLPAHQMDWVSSGESALDRLQTEGNYRALISELCLPGMSGLALAKQIRVDSGLGHLRTLVVTDVPVSTAPPGVEILSPPWTRTALLDRLSD